MKSKYCPPLTNGLDYFTDDNGKKVCKGAQLGRRNYLPEDRQAVTPKLLLHRLRFVDGDYDQGGAYWGYTPGTAIYRAACFDEAGSVVELFTRNTSREGAKLDVLEIIPHARFYR